MHLRGEVIWMGCLSMDVKMQLLQYSVLIIIDEPTSALDADSTGRVLSFFRRQAERGTAVLAVSHDKDFASGCHYLIEL